MSKLSSIELIQSIAPHPNADKLELAKVLGYTCIVGKDEFKPGDAVVLIQPDTELPDKEWAKFFKKRGNRVRAMKLRGVWSFGIVMSPYKVFEDDIGILKALLIPDRIGQDISDLTGVTKYEAPAPQHMDAKGYMPIGLGKTDEERYQNLQDLPFGELVDITLKIDGTSATYYCQLVPANLLTETEDIVLLGICSRSLELKPESDNNFTRLNAKFNILDKLEAYCRKHQVSLALRGEIYGQGIQHSHNNPHSKGPVNFAVFSVYNMSTHEYEHRGSTHYFENVASALGIQTVPMIETGVELTPEKIKFYAEDISTLKGVPFEGVVIKHSKGTFKVMNLAYDEKKS